MSIDTFELPKLDMQMAISCPDKSATQLRTALESVGFVRLINLGPHFQPAQLLESMRWFFSQSLEYKMKLATATFRPDCHNNFRGYLPVQEEVNEKLGKSRNKETFEFGGEFTFKRGEAKTRDVVCESNMWPPEDGTQSNALNFRREVQKYFAMFSLWSQQLLTLMARGFNLGEATYTYLTDMFDGGEGAMSVGRLFHYPNGGCRGAQAMKDHTDRGLISILTTFDYEGLQVQHDGKWYAVPGDFNSVIVNTGDLLERLFDGRVKATRHQVIDPGTERFSFPFFYEPHFYADLDKTLTGKPLHTGSQTHYGYVRAEELSKRPENVSVDFGIDGARSRV